MLKFLKTSEGFPGGSVVKNPSANTGDVDLIRGSGRSPGEGNGNPLQYSHQGNPMGRGDWWATVHGVTKASDMTWLNNNNNCPAPVLSFLFHPLSKNSLVLHFILCTETHLFLSKNWEKYAFEVILSFWYYKTESNAYLQTCIFLAIGNSHSPTEISRQL